MFNRNRDTTEVFNDRWRANHDVHSQVKEKKEQEGAFRQKMLGVYKEQGQVNSKVQSSMEMQLNRLNRNMSGLNSLNNKKW